MTNPLTPQNKPERSDRLQNDKQDGETQLEQDKENTARLLSDVNPPVQKEQHNIYRKSEFRVDETDTLTKFRPIIDKFLLETSKLEESFLTNAEKDKLSQTRHLLTMADTSEQVISNALHLARLYRHLQYIEEAKKAVTLSLGVDPDHMQAKELFQELEHLHPIDIGVSETVAIQHQLTKSALRQRIHALGQGKIIVLGDLLIDELLEGRPERISREAPVLILEHVDTVLVPGGAANAAHNVASLGGKCHAIGICGHDHYANKLAGLLAQCNITHSLIEDTNRPTTVKTRILSKSHSLMQQLLRLDRISHEPIDVFTEAKIIEKLKHCAKEYDAIVLSDYRSGIITSGIIHEARHIAKEFDLMLIVDAQEKFDRFHGCTLITPNQPDVEKAIGFAIKTKEDLRMAGEKLQSMSGSKFILITRGSEGMILFEQNKEPFELPVFNRSAVFDVTGAGDTVVATMALALSTGASPVEAMALGNLAAGIVVRKPGTAVTNQHEMIENLERLNLPV